MEKRVLSPQKKWEDFTEIEKDDMLFKLEVARAMYQAKKTRQEAGNSGAN